MLWEPAWARIEHRRGNHALQHTAAQHGRCSGPAGWQGGRSHSGFRTGEARCRAKPSVMSPDAGWIDALAVTPEMQRTFVGCGLLRRAEAGCATRAAGMQSPVGASARLPRACRSNRGAESFFAAVRLCAEAARRSFVGHGRGCQHVRLRYAGASCLGSRGRRCGRATRLPCSPIWRREFPGRWRYEAEEFLANGGAITDFVLLLVDIGRRRRLLPAHVRGLHPPDGSASFPAAGPGVSSRLHRHQRTPRKGWGGLLLDTGLCYLRDRGLPAA